MERKDLKPIEREVEVYFGTYETESVYDKAEADSVMDAMEAEIKELELALENSREHSKALRKCFEGHRKQIKELQEEINVANQCTQEKLQRIKKLEADKLRQENYCESLVNENNRLNEIIISKDMVGAVLVNENKALRFNLEDWKHKAEEMELTAKSFDAEIARSPDRIQKLTTENADLVMEVEKLQERIEELNAENIVKDMVGAELHNENKELKQKLETRIAMWEHERNLRKEIAHDWAKAKEMEVEKLQERIKELEKVVEEKQMLLNIGKICP